MQNRFELPLFISVKPSRRLVAVFYFVHLGAVLSLATSNIPLLIQLLIIVALLASLIHGHHLYISRKNPHSAVQLVLNQAGEWLLTLTNGNDLPVTLKPMAFVHPWLVVMLFHDGKRTYPVILTPETVDADTYRRLRVRLRFKNSNKD